jgi:hypothetical protein
MLLRIVYTIFCCAVFSSAFCQSSDENWHGIERTAPYKLLLSKHQPLSFYSVNGKRRFNRALYGTNTGFRVEAGDLPEFALYMPGMGGNFKLGVSSAAGSKWLSFSSSVAASYYEGKMNYNVYDSVIGGTGIIDVLPCWDRDGMIVAIRFYNLDDSLKLVWAFGGATGKRFSRDGDIGADPESSFYMQPDYCKDNSYVTEANKFRLTYGQGKQITGIVPTGSTLKIVDAAQQENPQSLYASVASATPAIAGEIAIKRSTTYYFLIQAGVIKAMDQKVLAREFEWAELALQQKAGRVWARGGYDRIMAALSIALPFAADAIWEHPTYMHGAVAWRMRLPAWRGAYVADPLGWHDRAKTHFSSYAKSQVTSPDHAAVVMDTALHLARHLEKIGTGMFTSGYICRNPNGDIRPHHYDMNLVFIDQLMNHFNWTGDKKYVKEMWPVIERHLAWEKRNFDADGDGLYDAYCCIWASDALQYSGGGVTHASAYNYRIFKTAAELASLIGVDGSAYKKESEKILQAVNRELWLPKSGWYAEYKDLLGKKLVHPIPGLWTIYHALDAKLPDPFQAWQATRFVDTEIPHIPVKAKGLDIKGLYILSTSNYQPYTWSVNNVALAENLHMALAYWQANRPNEAYHLFRSALTESMFLGASPGGFQQLSFYDAIRGQLYRDFADPVGIAARTLVEGLYGIQPDALHDTLFIRPGYPSWWELADLKLPDIEFNFFRDENKDSYLIKSGYFKKKHLKLHVRGFKSDIESVKINGRNAKWSVVENSVGEAMVQITSPRNNKYKIEITWKGDSLARIVCDSVYVAGDSLQLFSGNATIQSIYDPQHVLSAQKFNGNKLTGIIQPDPGNKTFFAQLKQGSLSWWQPVYFKVVTGIEVVTKGNTVFIQTKDTLYEFMKRELIPGTNVVYVETKYHSIREEVLHWQVKANPDTRFEKIDLAAYYNEKVTNIFKQQYLSPRPTSPTLQLPTQGIGNWCYPLTTAEISDSGLRAQAGIKNEIILPQGIPFSTPGDTNRNNIIFTSQWDNFPDSVIIPLSGKSSHAYMLMAGSTNPMQSRMVNGELRIHYTDGSFDLLPLKNPVNWWPIEQDYLNDGYAFTTDGYIPLRYYLKKGIAATEWKDYITIRGFSNRGIDGGAATVLDLPLNAKKELKSIVIHTIANDVVIGLMSLTLVR